MNTRDFKTLIRPRTGWFDINLKEVWKYRDLTFLFVLRNFTTLYKQSILGPIWLILTPIATSLVYSFVFGNIAKISTDGLPYILFYMSGTTLWSMFTGCVTRSSGMFLDNMRIFTKVYFPRLTMVIASALTSFVNFAIQFLLLVIVYIVFLIKGSVSVPTWNWLLLPVFWLQTLLLGTAVGLIISSLTVKYRDLKHSLNLVMGLWMYLTPIIYPLSSTSGIMGKILLVNPMTPVIQNSRYLLLGNGLFLGWPWILSACVTIILSLASVIVFSQVEKTFADMI